MSVKVMSAIFDRYPHGGGEMLLALALADHAHEDGTSVRPSVKLLAKKTRQSERTVQYQLRKMQAYGWLILVRNSSGKPGYPNEYKINSAWLTGAESDGCNFCTGAIDNMDGCNVEHGRVQKGANTGAIAVAPKPLYKPSVKQPSVEPSLDAGKPRTSLIAADLIVIGISQQIASDFLAIRKAKRAPLTTTALDGIQREAEKAGITLQQALTTCIERGWQGYKAEWDKREGQGAANTTGPSKNGYAGGQVRYAEQPLDYPLAEPDKDIYTGPVDVKAAMDSIAAMRANLKLDEEAF